MMKQIRKHSPRRLKTCKIEFVYNFKKVQTSTVVIYSTGYKIYPVLKAPAVFREYCRDYKMCREHFIPLLLPD